MLVSTMAFTSSGPLHFISSRVQGRSSPVTGPNTLVQAGVRKVGKIVCAGEQVAPGGGHADPPRLEPFSQSRLSRAMRERSFLQKAEDALNDKCMALEGEAAYECWEALFEYENIKEDAEIECSIATPEDRENACQRLERFENMVRQSGGVNSLIDNVRMVARIKEAKKLKPAPDEEQWLKAVSASASAAGQEEVQPSERHEHEFTEDGGIPKTAQEMEDEIEGLMPESPFSRILKRKGHHGFGKA